MTKLGKWRQNHQQGLNLLHTYWQITSSFGYGGVVVGMRTIFLPNYLIVSNRTKLEAIFIVAIANITKGPTPTYVGKIIYGISCPFS